MADFWTERKQFEKTGKFILRDWTKKLIIIDLDNAMNEKYHFEIPPEADANGIPNRPSGGPVDNIILNMFMPIITKTKI